MKSIASILCALLLAVGLWGEGADIQVGLGSSGGSASGAASGDLSGTYPAPTVAKINGETLATISHTAGTYVGGDGVAVKSLTFSGDLTTNSSGVATVGRINGVPLGSTTATSANVLIADGTNWVTRALSGDLTIGNTGVATLKNTGTAGTYQSVTTDAQGRITAGTALTTAMLPKPLRVLGSDCTQHSTTSASEVVLTTIAVSSAVGATIPANSIIYVDTIWTGTVSTNQKTWRARIGATASGTGGTQFLNIQTSTGTVASYYRRCPIFVRSSTSELFMGITNFTSESTSTVAPGTAAIDLAAGFDITICGACAASDTASIEAVVVYCFTP